MNQDLIKKERLYVTILAAIQVAHIIDFVIMMPLGPTLMQEFGITPTEFAGLVSSYNFSSALFGIIISVIADRFDRRSLLVFSMTGFIIGTFMCGYSSGFKQLLGARILTGSFGGVINTSVMAIATDLIPFERRGKALGVIMSAFSISSIMGVPLGLAISDHYGWHMSFYTIALFGLIINLLAFFFIPKLKNHIKKVSSRDVFKEFAKTLVYAKYFKGYLFIFCMAASTFSLIPFLSPFSVKNIGIQTTDLKYLYLVGGFFTIFSARFLGKATDKFGAFKVFSIVLLISLLPILAYTHAKPMSLGYYLILTTCFMTIVSGRMIPGMTLISSIPKVEERGRFMGVMNSIRSLGSAGAAIISGMIITESVDGKLLNMPFVGYLSITLALITLLLAYQINKRSSLCSMP